MAVQILTNRVPGHLRISQGMVEDLITDPRMAAKVMLDMDFDEFQSARLRYMWWVPFVEDHSGVFSGKTIVDWAYIQLRCLFMPDHVAGVIYQTFDIGKRTFWAYYRRCRSPIFRAQLGRMDIEGEEEGKSSTEGSACYRYFYKNGSCVEMPAPAHKTKGLQHGSWRVNTLLWEEWTKAMGMLQASDDTAKQLIGRVAKPCYNQHHPIWCNHLTRTAAAETGVHPAYRTHVDLSRRARSGDPSVATVRWSYKDYSNHISNTGKTFNNEYRMDAIIRDLRGALSREKFLGEALGIWSRSSMGWYTDQMMQAALELGLRLGVTPVISRAGDIQESQK